MGFSSQLGQAVINLLIAELGHTIPNKQTCSADATKYYFTRSCS